MNDLPEQDKTLVRFIEALPNGTEAARLLYTMSDTFVPSFWQRRHSAVAALDVLRVGVVPAESAEWQGPYYGIQILFGEPMRVDVLFPEAFRALESAREFLRRRGQTYEYYIYRVRVIVFCVCDMLLTDRLNLMLGVRRTLGVLPPSLFFRVSPDDGCMEPDVATLSRAFGMNNLLLPDGYYYEQDGYAPHKERVACDPRQWIDRSDIVLWRGTTSGAAFSAANLEANERIHLAAHCAARPDLFDVKINSVCQVPEADLPTIRALLQERNLLADSVPMDDFRRHKFAMHIDGNTSAASFFEKMALGCCILRVASRFEQWIEPRIKPWVHFVPIAMDLSNLVETLEALRSLPELAHTIAQAACNFAITADFRSEAHFFCNALVASLGMTDAVRWQGQAGQAKRAGGEIILQLGAPSSFAGFSGSSGGVFEIWYDIETFADNTWRWTRSDRVSWQVTVKEAAYAGICIEIPLVNEISPGFAAASKIEVAGQLYPVSVKNRILSALVYPGEAFSGVVSLLTPPPKSPLELGRGNDSRVVGVAIGVI